MSDLHNLFVDFNRTISLSDTKVSNLRRGRDALRKKIKNWFKDNKK